MDATCFRCGELRLPGQRCPCTVGKKKHTPLPGTAAIAAKRKAEKKVEAIERAKKMAKRYSINATRDRPSRQGRVILIFCWLVEDITSCFQRNNLNKWVLIPEKAGLLHQSVARALYLLALLSGVKRQRHTTIKEASEHWTLIKEQSE